MENVLLRIESMEFPLIYLQIEIDMYFKYLYGRTLIF